MSKVYIRTLTKQKIKTDNLMSSSCWLSVKRKERFSVKVIVRKKSITLVTECDAPLVRGVPFYGNLFTWPLYTHTHAIKIDIACQFNEITVP